MRNIRPQYASGVNVMSSSGEVAPVLNQTGHPGQQIPFHAFHSEMRLASGVRKKLDIQL